jgi:hypothetical protein
MTVAITRTERDAADRRAAATRSKDAAAARRMLALALVMEAAAHRRCHAMQCVPCEYPRLARGRSLPAATVAASPMQGSRWGDTQQPAHGGNRIVRLVAAHEPEPRGGIAFVSRVNQAAAFGRISRSSRS